MTTPDDPEALLRAMFDAAVASAQPEVCVPPALPDPPKGRTVVLGGGKASALGVLTLLIVSVLVALMIVVVYGRDRSSF